MQNNWRGSYSGLNHPFFIVSVWPHNHPYSHFDSGSCSHQAAMKALDFAAVRKDLEALMTNSQVSQVS